MNAEICQGVARLIQGTASGPRWFQMRWLPNVEGLVAGRKIELRFPDGGPWVLQRRRMKIRMHAAGGVRIKLRAFDLDARIAALKLPEDAARQLRTKLFGYFDSGFGPLVIRDGSAKYEMVLPAKVTKMSPAQIVSMLEDFAEAVRILCEHAPSSV